MNAADPLSELRPLQLPDPIGWWPPAPGWWLLFFMLCVLLAVSIWLALRAHRLAAFRRQALRELEFLAASAQNRSSPEIVAGLNALLKRVALVRHPTREVARLSGEQWLQFLECDGADAGFSQGPGRALADLAYRPCGDADLPAIVDLCRRWIRTST